jgi:hypothetical protein
MNPGAAATPLYELFAELIDLEQVNSHFARMLSAVDVHYGTAEPPVGHFLPDLTLRTSARDTVRARELFAAGRPVLFDLADDAAVRKTADGFAGRVDTVTAEPLDGPPNRCWPGRTTRGAHRRGGSPRSSPLRCRSLSATEVQGALNFGAKWRKSRMDRVIDLDRAGVCLLGPGDGTEVHIVR